MDFAMNFPFHSQLSGIEMGIEFASLYLVSQHLELPEDGLFYIKYPPYIVSLSSERVDSSVSLHQLWFLSFSCIPNKIHFLLRCFSAISAHISQLFPTFTFTVFAVLASGFLFLYFSTCPKCWDPGWILQ